MSKIKAADVIMQHRSEVAAKRLYVGALNYWFFRWPAMLSWEEKMIVGAWWKAVQDDRVAGPVWS